MAPGWATALTLLSMLPRLALARVRGLGWGLRRAEGAAGAAARVGAVRGVGERHTISGAAPGVGLRVEPRELLHPLNLIGQIQTSVGPDVLAHQKGPSS